jgi:AcrR family transcriptional regulator
MVERILDACARILVASGYDQVSTYRIANEAGISPGSLYQYFPDKDSVVAAAVERMVEQIGAELATALAGPDGTPPGFHARQVVTAIVDITERHRELARVLVEQMPRLGGSVQIRAIEQRATDVVTGYLAGTGNVAMFGKSPAAVWIAVQALQQIPVRYVLDSPSISREEFIDELSRLVEGFLMLPAQVPQTTGA